MSIYLNQKPLKHFLLENDLTQQAFAEQQGLDVGRLSAMLTGRHNVSTSYVEALMTSTGQIFETLFSFKDAS